MYSEFVGQLVKRTLFENAIFVKIYPTEYQCM